MKFSGRHIIERQREELFEKLQDPAVLMECIPGCEELVRNPDGSYEARICIRAGLLRVKFTGWVVLRDVVPPAGYSMEIEGRGRLGSLSGTSRIDLLPVDGSSTEIVYESEVRLGGPIAGLVERLVQEGAGEVPRHFFSSLEKTLRAEEGS